MIFKKTKKADAPGEVIKWILYLAILAAVSLAVYKIFKNFF
jgi:hypothetical protein